MQAASAKRSKNGRGAVTPMAGDHTLEARLDRIKADMKASRKHLAADAEKLLSHGRAWWKTADKRTIALAGAGVAVVGLATLYLLMRDDSD